MIMLFHILFHIHNLVIHDDQFTSLLDMIVKLIAYDVSSMTSCIFLNILKLFAYDISSFTSLIFSRSLSDYFKIFILILFLSMNQFGHHNNRYEEYQLEELDGEVAWRRRAVLVAVKAQLVHPVLLNLSILVNAVVDGRLTNEDQKVANKAVNDLQLERSPGVPLVLKAEGPGGKAEDCLNRHQ